MNTFTLAGRNGYLTLKIEEKLFGEEMERRGMRQSAPARGIPVMEYFEDDDSLPF